MPNRSIRPVLGFLGLGLLLLLAATMATADTEPNDDRGDAEPIEASTYVGTLNMTDRLDVYEIQVVGSDIIGLSFRTLTSGTQYMGVNDTTGGTVATLESTGGVRAMVNIYIGCDLDMEWWYLEVSVGPKGSEAPGDYEFSLFYDQQDDGGTECDAPSDIAHALKLDPGEYPCEYGFHDERDVYRVLVKAGWTLGICLECSEQAGPMRVQVFTGDDLVTPIKTEVVEDERSCEWLLPAATPVGTNWYFVLEGVSDETYGEYTLRVDMDETDSGPPRILRVTPRTFDPGKDLKVKVTIEEDTEIDAATLHYRKDSKGTWKEVPLVLDGDVYAGKIGKGDLSGADRLEYYIEATDTTGFHGVLGSETDVETMRSSGESPGFGSAVMVIALASAVVALGSRRRS